MSRSDGANKAKNTKATTASSSSGATSTKPGKPKVEAVVFNERPAAAAAAAAAAKIQKFKRAREDGPDSDDELEKKGKRRTDDGLRLFDIHDLNIGKGDSLNSVIKADELKKKGVQLGHIEAAFATKRFYYQRNMYLTGFTLFLSLILNRTFVMLLDLVKSEERMEVVKKQAAQQSKEYTRLLESESTLQKELKDLTEIAASHSSTKQDLDNLKKQAKQQQEEYLRMADDNTVLQKRLKGSKSENRKDI
ncbi:hypothetical protein BGZ52_002280 [Haplosporangium bisporale]|nr:hypothetical protein BGZ52_002280 [Haplosporangium bisporale]